MDSNAKVPKKPEAPKQEEKVEEEKPKVVARGEEITVIDDKRLFVMNLSYEVTHDEMKDLFGPYGEIEDVEIPLRKFGGGIALGISFIRFKATEGAIAAFAGLD
jgi:multiple RNA-binding domain-containing protein 1